MNKKLKIKTIFIFVLSIYAFTCHSQTVDSPYEVGTWHGFRQTAINYTFDDGTSGQFAKAIPIFNEYGFNLTLFTVTNWSPNWTNLQNAASQGHEVASHTVSHPNFGDIDIDEEITELKDSKDAIENNVSGQQCITMAYPYCAIGNDSICNSYYIAARGCQGFIEPSTPGSFMNISSVICGSEGSVKTIDHFKTKFESAAKSNGWLVFLLHGVDNDGGYSPLSSEILENSLIFLSDRTSKFWVTTFKNTALYVKERNDVTVLETSNEDSNMTLQVTDNLPDSIYNYPLTIRRPLPAEWPSADVFQNNDSVPTRIVKIESVVYLMFDVIPDAGEVKISKNKIYVEPEIDTIPPDIAETPENNDTTAQTSIKIHEKNSVLSDNNIKVTVNERNLIILMQVPSDFGFLVSLFDLKGTCLLSQNVTIGTEGRANISLPNNLTESGMYIVRMTDGKDSWATKFMIKI